METSSSLYELSFETRPNYLFVFASGDLGRPETRIDCWREIIERCRAEGAERLLVVQDGPGNATPSDAFTSSAGIVALGLHGIKIAFVDIHPEHLENNQFGEMVAENRGAWAKVFTNEAEAMEWLEGE